MKTKPLTLTVSGMHCKSCVIIVEEVLADLGAKNITVNLNEKTQQAHVSCSSDKSIEDIKNAIEQEGYKVKP